MIRRYLISRELILAIAILCLIGLIAIKFPGFIAPGNLVDAFNDTSPLIILAMGQMIVILTRCIDLSVAANLALTGMIVATINTQFPALPIPALILIALIAGTLMGAVNGLLTWKLDIPPIVVTLGTMTIYRGLVFVLSEGQWINAHEMSDSFKAFPRYEILNLPVLSWFAILITVALIVLVSKTPLGRAFYAVGGNPNAAVYAGIDVGRTQFLAFTISGALAGLTGYLWVSRYAVAYVDIAGGFELDVVAACVIGGISIAGGVGTIVGAFLGAIFLGVIKNALPVVGISPFAQLAISGAAIITAVAFNSRTRNRQSRLILKREEATIE